jgi:hypothetical protein
LTGGANLSANRREGQRRLEAGTLSIMETEIEHGIDAARGPAGPGEEAGNPGRSGLTRWPGLAGLIFIGKNQKGFDF